MAGLKFRILKSFWLLLAFSLFIRQAYIFGLYTLSVLIHESAHYFVAKKCGYKCNCIAISAFGAVLYGEFDSVDNRDGVKIALAGPAANAVCALVFVALWWMFPALYVFSQPFVAANVSLCLINLLPAYPLDGGRVFVSLLSAKTDYAKALKVSKILSVALSGALFFVFLCMCFAGAPNFSLGLFAVFVLSVGLSETKGEIFSKQIVFEVYKKRLDRGVEKKTLVFSEEATLKSVAKRMSHHFVYRIEVVEAKDGEVKKVFSHAQFLHLLSSHALDTPLKELL